MLDDVCVGRHEVPALAIDVHHAQEAAFPRQRQHTDTPCARSEAIDDICIGRRDPNNLAQRIPGRRIGSAGTVRQIVDAHHALGLGVVHRQLTGAIECQVENPVVGHGHASRTGGAAWEFDMLFEFQGFGVKAAEAADAQLAIPYVRTIRAHRQTVDLLAPFAPRHGRDLEFVGLPALGIEPAHLVVDDVRKPDPSVPVGDDTVVRVEGDVVHADRRALRLVEPPHLELLGVRIQAHQGVRKEGRRPDPSVTRHQSMGAQQILTRSRQTLDRAGARVDAKQAIRAHVGCVEVICAIERHGLAYCIRSGHFKLADRRSGRDDQGRTVLIPAHLA